MSGETHSDSSGARRSFAPPPKAGAIAPAVQRSSALRALIWEECRTAGVIAAAMTAVGAIMLLHCRWTIGPDAWDRDPTFAGWGLIGIPLITALLMILNPDYSGNLTGGFSRRILRLPLTTSQAVAPALASRLAFILASSAVLVLLSTNLLEKGPSFEVTFGIGTLYLVAQTVDWLRRPVSGLSSVIVVLALAEAVFRIIPPLADVLLRVVPPPFNLPPSAWVLSVLPRWPLAAPIAIVVAPVMAFMLAVVSVNADRVGKRFGIPEVWQWPQYISISSTRKRRPFRSAISAQVWFELRRSMGLLPLGTLVAWVLILGAIWLFGYTTPKKTTDAGLFKTYAAFALGPALWFGALLHGARTSVLGFRTRTGRSDYDLMQPLSVAEFTRARVLANVALLVPTVLAALAVHIALGGPDWMTDIIPRGVTLGMTSLQEAIGIFLGRGLVAGLMAWPLMYVGTRLFRRIVGLFIVGLAFAIVTGWLTVWHQSVYVNTHNREIVYSVLWASLAFPVIVALVQIWFARRRELIPRRTAVVWIGTWVLAAWVIAHAAMTPWNGELPPMKESLAGIGIAIGLAAWIPAGIVSLLIDVWKKRHGSRRTLDPAQHAGIGNSRRFKPFLVTASIFIVAAILWLGWPLKPAIFSYRKSIGFPSTLAEFNAWDSTPQAKYHRPSEIDRIADEHTTLAKAYWSHAHRPNSHDVTDANRLLLIVGGATLPLSGPIPGDTWKATEEYWNDVTFRIAPKLREIAAGGAPIARYRVGTDIEGYPRLSVLRVLARELQLDALRSVVYDEPAQAIDDIAAIGALSDSLSAEPLVISQLVRSALISMAVNAAQTAVNRMAMTDAEYARLSNVLEKIVLTREALDRAIVGESAHVLTFEGEYEITDDFRSRRLPFSSTVVELMIYPLAGERTASSLQIRELLKHSADPWPEFSAKENEVYRNSSIRQVLFMAPQAFISGPALWRSYETVWNSQMRISTARTAIAIERYRLANGHPPKSLEELATKYLPSTPEDHFAGPGKPLGYRVRGDGAYVVHSVGRDMIDSLDKTDKKGQPLRTDDIRFEIAPAATRSGQQVAAPSLFSQPQVPL